MKKRTSPESTKVPNCLSAGRNAYQKKTNKGRKKEGKAKGKKRKQGENHLNRGQGEIWVYFHKFDVKRPRRFLTNTHSSNWGNRPSADAEKGLWQKKVGSKATGSAGDVTKQARAGPPAPGVRKTKREEGWRLVGGPVLRGGRLLRNAQVEEAERGGRPETPQNGN